MKYTYLTMQIYANINILSTDNIYLELPLSYLLWYFEI